MPKCIMVCNTKYVRLKVKGEKKEMTCKDCINFNECLSKEKRATRYYSTNVSYNDVENRCKYFKNKLRYIELPCNIGDKAYYISVKDELKEIKITGFNIDRYGICDVECESIDSGFTFTLSIDEVYFNKLQAEKEIDKLNNIKTLKQE